MRTGQARAARKASFVEARLFWAALLALAVGVVTLVLALGVSLIGAATGGDRNSMSAVYLALGLISLVVAGVIGLARHIRGFRRRRRQG